MGGAHAQVAHGPTRVPSSGIRLMEQVYRAVDSYPVGPPFIISLGAVIITDKTHTDWYLVPG